MILNAKEILKQLYNCCDLIEERLLDGDEKPGCDLRKQLSRNEPRGFDDRELIPLFLCCGRRDGRGKLVHERRCAGGDGAVFRLPENSV